MIKLSKRLEAVARLVSKGSIVCDVGTDHGYIPIWLVQTRICSRALAMDVNEGPLERAREHIAEYGLTDYIETRRGDGLLAMRKKECDSVVIAGMGGNLTMRILEESRGKLESVRELILQPQSDIGQVRRYVAAHGFAIDQQDMVKEDGKYYMMFRCIHGGAPAGEERTETDGDRVKMACDRYGEQLLLENHPVLVEYLEKELRVLGEIRQSLTRQRDSEAASRRFAEIEEKQQVIATAQKIMEKGAL